MITIRLRNDLAYVWSAKNPILDEGEIGQELDTGRFKMGNGSTRWTFLPYYIPTTEIAEMIRQAIVEAQLGVDGTAALNDHVNSENPHPVYDDGPSLLLLYQNAKV